MPRTRPAPSPSPAADPALRKLRDDLLAESAAVKAPRGTKGAARTLAESRAAMLTTAANAVMGFPVP